MALIELHKFWVLKYQMKYSLRWTHYVQATGKSTKQKNYTPTNIACWKLVSYRIVSEEKILRFTISLSGQSFSVPYLPLRSHSTPFIWSRNVCWLKNTLTSTGNRIYMYFVVSLLFSPQATFLFIKSVHVVDHNRQPAVAPTTCYPTVRYQQQQLVVLA